MTRFTSSQLKFQPRRRRNSDDNMIPLINIVFLLLIFFMIAGQMHDNVPALRLPVSPSEQPAEHSELRIAINRDQSLYLNGRLATLEQLPALLDANPKVNLLVDRELLAADLDTVLNVLRRAGATGITLVTESAEGE